MRRFRHFVFLRNRKIRNPLFIGCRKYSESLQIGKRGGEPRLLLLGGELFPKWKELPSWGGSQQGERLPAEQRLRRTGKQLGFEWCKRVGVVVIAQCNTTESRPFDRLKTGAAASVVTLWCLRGANRAKWSTLAILHQPVFDLTADFGGERNAQITEGEKVLEFVSAGEDRFSPENLLPAL